MKTNTVELGLKAILDDLNNGLTWLKKEDVGYGSIQAKYNANEIAISTIRKHPKLVGVEPTITVFNIIDDLDESNIPTPETKKPESSRTSNYTPKPDMAVASDQSTVGADESAFNSL